MMPIIMHIMIYTLRIKLDDKLDAYFEDKYDDKLINWMHVTTPSESDNYLDDNFDDVIVII